MRFAVPFFVLLYIAQAKIGGQVNDARRNGRPVIDFLLCLAVRKREEQNIARLNLIGRSELNFGSPAQIGMHVIELLANVRFGRDLREFGVRM